MKKLLLPLALVLFLLLLAGAAAPYWMGMQTETDFTDRLNAMAKTAGIPAQQISFERGWFSSHATNKFMLPGTPFVIHADHQIEHGPLPLSRLRNMEIAPAIALIRTTLVLNTGKAAPAKTTSLVKNLPPIKLTSIIDLSGDLSSSLTIDGGSRKLVSGSLRWMPVTGMIFSGRGGRHIKSELTLPLVTHKGSDIGMTLKNLKFVSDHKEGKAGYMFGHSKLSFAKLEITPLIELNGLQISSKSQSSGRFVNSTLNYDLKKAVVSNESYGPGTIQLVIRRLDTATLKKFENELNKLYARTLPDEQFQLMLVGKLIELGGNLSRHNPELELTRLHFKTNAGDLVGSAKFVVQGDKQNITTNPMQILTAIKGEAELSIPASLAKAAVMPQIQLDLQSLKAEGSLSQNETQRLSPEAIKRIADKVYPRYVKESSFGRWFVREGDQYKFSLSIDRGNVIINGVPLLAVDRR